MKIAVIIPNSTMPPDMQDLRRAFLQARAAPDCTVEVWRNDVGPASIETEAERDEAAVEILRHALRRDLSDVSALIPWCAADPGLDALRQALPIPVVGPLIASCHAASMLGHRFSVVIPAGSIGMTRHRIEGYGFGGKLASVRQVNRPVLELRADLPNTIELFRRQIEAAVAEDGADAVILGCMALFGVAGRIPASVPVVDPALAALSAAEGMVRMGLSNSLADAARCAA